MHVISLITLVYVTHRVWFSSPEMNWLVRMLSILRIIPSYNLTFWGADIDAVREVIGLLADRGSSLVHDCS